MTLIAIGENVYYPLSEGYILYIGQRSDIEKLSSNDLVDLVYQTIAQAKHIHLSPQQRMAQ